MPDDTPSPLSAKTAPKATPAGRRPALRRKLLSIFAALLLAAAICFGLWSWLVGRNYVSTDNAYVGADMAQITPQLDEAVVKVSVGDTDSVKQGDILIELDSADAHIAVAKAEADLAGISAHVAQTIATSRALQAEIPNRQAAVHHAQASQVQARAALEKARIDLRRREELQDSGAVSAEELTAARNSFTAAQAALNQSDADIEQAAAAVITATAQRDANDALIAGHSVEDHPDVLSARSALDRAKLDLSRTVIRAPIDGIVTQRHVQVGQRVKVGDVLMSVVPIGQLYVDANFKESQLAKVRPGQSVELTSDLYGSGVVFHGIVTGFSGGTGAALAIIPAQNATGNWIKVVQRLPVRVSLKPEETKAHPLRIGLSMDAVVDLRSGR
jgi:membrane fusion protein (multidrug efflux system)